MNPNSTFKSTLAGAAVLAVLVGASTAGAMTDPGIRPSAQTQPQRADQLRSEALNLRYGLGGPTAAERRADQLRSEALNLRYGLGGPTVAELRADRLRSEALNVRYGLGGPTAAELRALRLRSEGLNALYAASRQATNGSSATSGWTYAGLGVAAALVALALGGLVVLTGRRGRTTHTATAA